MRTTRRREVTKTEKTINFLIPYIFLSPFFILFIIFGIFPVVFSFSMAFQKWSGMGSAQFLGLHNYIFMLFHDKYFWKTVGTTVWLLIFGSFSQHLVAFPLATILNNKLVKGRDIFRTTYFLPFITSSVSISLIFHYIFGANYGLLNFIISSIGLDKLAWLDDKKLIPVSLAIIINWRYVGWNTVIYLAGLQSIPHSLYEAAEIDGAGSIRKHLAITLPLLLPIVFFAITLSIIGGMQIFDEPFVILNGYQGMGGTDKAGFTSAFYIMWLLQRASRLGRGSTVSWLLFLMVLGMTLINRKITNALQAET